MPDELGTWTWSTSSNAAALNGQVRQLQCVAPEAGNRGPVSVRDSYHFGYADGTPYVECGTTCYAWAFQSEATQRQTIETLAPRPSTSSACAFFPSGTSTTAKSRRCIRFRAAARVNDYSTFNAAYFQHLDRLILELSRIGVQADLILFHPYDKWGYQSMPAEVDDRYLRYVIARFSAYPQCLVVAGQ